MITPAQRNYSLVLLIFYLFPEHATNITERVSCHPAYLYGCSPTLQLQPPPINRQLSMVRPVGIGIRNIFNTQQRSFGAHSGGYICRFLLHFSSFPVLCKFFCFGVFCVFLICQFLLLIGLEIKATCTCHFEMLQCIKL